jgi:hypothetical protein
MNKISPWPLSNGRGQLLIWERFSRIPERRAQPANAALLLLGGATSPESPSRQAPNTNSRHQEEVVNIHHALRRD